MSETELAGRLERLERDNRRLKRFALAALVLAATLATIYATQPVPESFTAHEFNVVDDSGGVRVKMGMLLGKPVITFFDAQNMPRALMGVDSSGAPNIYFNDAQGTPRMDMSIGESGPYIMLRDAGGNPGARLEVTASGQPEISLLDQQGFGLFLGNTSTITPTTGGTAQTSAASIVMSDKGHRIIWRAP
jgi:hypothetical protein